MSCFLFVVCMERAGLYALCFPSACIFAFSAISVQVLLCFSGHHCFCCEVTTGNGE